MTQYRCFYSRHVGDVSEFILIYAATDALATQKAETILRSHNNYASVDIFTDSVLLGQIEREVPPVTVSHHP